MNISKKILSLVASAALALTGLVATGGAASAANTNFYKLNLNTSSAASNARDFTECNGKTYFSADSADHGRAIFSTSSTTPGTSTFVTKNAAAGQMGNPTRFSCVGNFLVYSDYQGDNASVYTVFSYNTVTNTNAELKGPGDVSFSAAWEAFPKVVTLNGVGYFFGTLNDGNNSQSFYTINPTTGAVTLEVSGANESAESLVSFGGKLYASMPASGWNTNDGKLMTYDTATQTWSQVAGSNVISNPAIVGQFRYNGADVLVVTGNGAFTVATDGTVSRLGNWGTNWSTQFVNFGERLFTFQWNAFSEIDATNGSLNDLKQTLWPNGTNIMIERAVESGNYLYMMARVTDTSMNPSTIEAIWAWPGSASAMALAATINPGRVDSIPEYPNFQRGWSRVTDMAKVSDGVLVNLYVNPAIGYEPYFVKAGQDLVSLGNINTASEGSSPDLRCVGSTATADYMGAGAIDSNGATKNTLTEFKANGAYLDYSVTDLGTLSGPCAFASSGTDLYFQAWDNNQYLYKMDKDGQISQIGQLPEYGYYAVISGGKYIWSDDNTPSLWAYDLTTNTTTQLTTNGNDSISQIRKEELVAVGSKVYFVGQDNNTNNWDIYSVDPTNLSNPVVKVTNNTSNNWSSAPVSLTVEGTKIYFTASLEGTGGSKLYSYDTAAANAAPVMVVDLFSDADPNIVDVADRMFKVGNDFYVTLYDDNNYNNGRYVVKVNTTTKVATLQTLPAGFKVSCAASAGGKLLIESNQGVVNYLADSVVTDSGYRSANEAFCYSHGSSLGLYARTLEVSFANSNFGEEPVYVGALIPRAVKRLGTAVTEAPATGIGTAVDTGWVPGGSTNPPAVDTDNPDLGSLSESQDFVGTKGSINFADGSGFDIDAKGRIYPKFKSKYLVSASGSLSVTYLVSGKKKVLTCKVATFGSVKKLKKVPTKAVLYKSKKFCQMPPAAIKALKTGQITIKMVASVKRYYATTAKAKLPSGKTIKPLKRTLTVRMSAIRR